MSLWTDQFGRLYVDSQGRPIDCPICPCGSSGSGSGGGGGGFVEIPCCPGVLFPATLCLTTGAASCPELSNQAFTLTYTNTPTCPVGHAIWQSAIFTVCSTEVLWMLDCVLGSGWSLALGSYSVALGACGSEQGLGLLNPPPCSLPLNFSVSLENAVAVCCGMPGTIVTATVNRCP